MNIYLNVEISTRELDSKLLLAIIAAARGHQVLISDMSGIDRGFRSKLLAPGIFHTKCLTPFENKIKFHQTLIDNGYMITSIDEESGLDLVSYENFSKARYSENTIQQSSAVFTWGDFDQNFLSETFPKYKSKIFKTGSPRFDLLKQTFLKYWTDVKLTPKRPFLLVSSNMGKANHIKPFHEIIKENKHLGYYERDAKTFKGDFYWAAEDYRKTYYFIEAIKYLANNSSGFDIIFRPHPIENIQSWKLYLKDFPNVHVIREGTITPWIINCFALMHSGCTSAIEGTVAEKPVISYVPFQASYSATLTNKLGYCVDSFEKLSSTVNDVFEGRIPINQNNLSRLLFNKIYLDKNELAAEKIIKIWESLDNDKLSRPSHWGMYKSILKIADIKHMIGRFLRKLFPDRFSNYRQDFKFFPLNKDDIFKRITKLKNIIGIKEQLEVKMLSKRTILIRKF